MTEARQTTDTAPQDCFDAGAALFYATRDAMRDYRTAYSPDSDADDARAFGIGEYETPRGTLLCQLSYRMVERKRGSKPTIRTEWFLNGETITKSAFTKLFSCGGR